MAVRAAEVAMIQGLWHVSFTVSDLVRSVQWYCDVLGLEYVRGQVQANEYTARLVGFADVHLKVAQLRVPGMGIPRSLHQIELIEYVQPRGEPIPLDTNRAGVGHWAFQVDDLRAEYARMVALGVQFKSEPNEITAGVNKGGWAVYFLDPDGITLEMVQPPP
jgi:lactoylglutathione lyase